MRPIPGAWSPLPVKVVPLAVVLLLPPAVAAVRMLLLLLLLLLLLARVRVALCAVVPAAAAAASPAAVRLLAVAVAAAAASVPTAIRRLGGPYLVVPARTATSPGRVHHPMIGVGQLAHTTWEQHVHVVASQCVLRCLLLASPAACSSSGPAAPAVYLSARCAAPSPTPPPRPAHVPLQLYLIRLELGYHAPLVATPLRHEVGAGARRADLPVVPYSAAVVAAGRGGLLGGGQGRGGAGQAR